MKKLSVSEKIRRYCAKHPKATAKEVAVALDVKPAYVYSTLFMQRNKQRKEREDAQEEQQFDTKALTKLRKEFDTQGEQRFSIPNGVSVLAPKPKQKWEPVSPLTSLPPDPVNHPAHYKIGGVETIDFIEAKGLGYHLGNVVKYITRAGHKGTSSGMEDLKKARWYLDRAIEKNEITSPTK